MYQQVSSKRLLLSVFTFIALWSMSCQRTNKHSYDIKHGEYPDTFIVGTLYSPTSYFLYKGDIMGYNYDLFRTFAKDKKRQVKFKVLRNMNALIAALDSGTIDVIAYNIPVSAEYKEKVTHCGITSVTYQVLVQPTINGVREINDVTQLVGKDIYVECKSKYESRLRNLNEELGGGIKIHPVQQDTIMPEDLIEMVAEKEIPLTIVDNDIARLGKTYYPNIDVRLQVGFPQRGSWAVRNDEKWLADSIDKWAATKEVLEINKSLFSHYFEADKKTTEALIDLKKLKHGIISEYDHIFKKYAPLIGWDWKLLAAQGYVESNFSNTSTSWAGAQGIMQLMPQTARHYGLRGNDIRIPDKNIHAAVKSIRDIDKSLSHYIPAHDERTKFILAAYNSGIAHIYDAIALARKTGRNPTIWDGNVSEALLLKSNPKFYNDAVCKYGYFRGRQTVRYVKEVIKVYHLYKRY